MRGSQNRAYPTQSGLADSLRRALHRIIPPTSCRAPCALWRSCPACTRTRIRDRSRRRHCSTLHSLLGRSRCRPVASRGGEVVSIVALARCALQSALAATRKDKTGKTQTRTTPIVAPPMPGGGAVKPSCCALRKSIATPTSRMASRCGRQGAECGSAKSAAQGRRGGRGGGSS